MPRWGLWAPTHSWAGPGFTTTRRGWPCGCGIRRRLTRGIFWVAPSGASGYAPTGAYTEWIASMAIADLIHGTNMSFLTTASSWVAPNVSFFFSTSTCVICDQEACSSACVSEGTETYAGTWWPDCVCTCKPGWVDNAPLTHPRPPPVGPQSGDGNSLSEVSLSRRPRSQSGPSGPRFGNASNTGHQHVIDLRENGSVPDLSLLRSPRYGQSDFQFNNSEA